jgi:hypothetical protein
MVINYTNINKTNNTHVYKIDFNKYIWLYLYTHFYPSVRILPKLSSTEELYHNYLFFYRRNAMNEVYAHAVLGKHQHVVRYYSAWAEDDYMYIQNEYCNGMYLY